MATRRTLAIPTAAALSGALRIPSTDPSLPKALLRLSRSALLAVINEWLKTRNQATCGPLLGEDESNIESPYDTAQTLEELREVYHELQSRRGGKREVVDRVLEGDWRHGISLRQLAMVEVQALLDHPTSQRWAARKLERVVASDDDRGYKTAELDTDHSIPRLQGPVLVERLQNAIGSMVKAHYYLTRFESLSLALLRVQIVDSPYNSQTTLEAEQILKSGETLFVAFPDHCSTIYFSSSTGSRAGTDLGLRKIVTDTIARALSRPQQRYGLRNTSLIARSLSSMVFWQGPHGDSNALGGWSIFAAGTVEQSPLVPVTGHGDWDKTEVDQSQVRKRQLAEVERDADAIRLRKRRCQIAQKRFGKTGIVGDGRGIERLDIRLENTFHRSQSRKALGQRDSNILTKDQHSSKARSVPATSITRTEPSSPSTDSFRPRISLTFHGSHVFAGIRGLIESGAINGARMPGWMTGENGVSAGVVQEGRMKRRNGSTS